ncbi:MAG TPA: hypothetical protein ENK08_11935 [Chloroflexi bacterium]|nr:hypothetical protein [Chloroflexota bacterium]
MLYAPVVPYILLIAGTGVYLLGLAFGSLNQDRTHRSPTWARMVHSATLVGAALVWWRGKSVGTDLAGFATMVFWGMLFSFVGDLLMARVVPLPKYPIPGMAAFGVAHVLYILGYVRAGTALGLGSGLAWGIGVGAGLLLAVVLWWVLIRAPDADPVLGYGALGYALLLGGMAGAAAALAVQQPRFAILAVGALLFLVSDAILGNRLFRHNDWFLVGDVVWVLYTAGQSLIVFTLPMVV